MATLGYKDFLVKAINDHGFLQDAVQNPENFMNEYNLSPTLANKFSDLEEILNGMQGNDPQELNLKLAEKLNDVNTAWRDGFTDNYTDRYSDDG